MIVLQLITKYSMVALPTSKHHGASAWASKKRNGLVRCVYYRSQQNKDASQTVFLNGILIYMVLALKVISECEIKIVRTNAGSNLSMHCRHASTANEGILVT